METTKHSRRLEATKEMFYDISAADGGSSLGGFGGGLVDDDNDDAWIDCYLPWDFDSLKQIGVIMIPIATLTPMTISVVTNYGRIGEIYTDAGETINRGINVVANQLTELNIADAVDAHRLAARDYLGVDVRREVGQNTNVLVLGVRIRYNTPIKTSPY